MTEPSKNPILNERVKPAMLNPLVKHITPSADIKWVLLCVGIVLAIFANVMGLIQQGAGHRHTGGFEDRIPVPFLSPDPAP